MPEEHRIVLVPSMPEDMTLDIVYETEAGIAVQARDEQIQTLRDRGVAVVELFASGNDYAAAVYNLSRQQAIAALHTIQDTRLAALTPDERNQFGVA